MKLTQPQLTIENTFCSPAEKKYVSLASSPRSILRSALEQVTHIITIITSLVLLRYFSVHAAALFTHHAITSCKSITSALFPIAFLFCFDEARNSMLSLSGITSFKDERSSRVSYTHTHTYIHTHTFPHTRFFILCSHVFRTKSHQLLVTSVEESSIPPMSLIEREYVRQLMLQISRTDMIIFDADMDRELLKLALKAARKNQSCLRSRATYEKWRREIPIFRCTRDPKQLQSRLKQLSKSERLPLLNQYLGIFENSSPECRNTRVEIRDRIRAAVLDINDVRDYGLDKYIQPVAGKHSNHVYRATSSSRASSKILRCVGSNRWSNSNKSR